MFHNPSAPVIRFLRSEGEGTASNKEPELGGLAVYLSKLEKPKKTRGNPQQKCTSINFRLGRVSSRRSRAVAAGRGGRLPDVTLDGGVPTAITANNIKYNKITSQVCVLHPGLAFFASCTPSWWHLLQWVCHKPAPGVQMGSRRLEPTFRCSEEGMGTVGWLRYQGRRCSEVQKGQK